MLRSRKEFIVQSAMLATGALAFAYFGEKNKKPLLSFSTLGCPDWDFNRITRFAADHGYDGLEIRGILRNLDLPTCKEFSDAAKIKASLELVRETGLKIVCLGSSANLHSPDGPERKKHLDDARRFIDLAQQLNCSYVRVFPNIFPKDQERNATLDRISQGLRELGEYARGSDTKVVMETHGELVKTDDLEKIMQSVSHSHTGLVWDICNMWTITKEPPDEVYDRLKKWILHTHIKDGKWVDGKVQYDLLGKGEVPIFAAIDVLRKNKYKGYYSFEWEKMWHPEIAEPEIALADYPVAMKKHFERT